MKKALLLCALSAATLALAATPAFADTFNFSFNGPFYSGSGTLQANEFASGEYNVTGISGSVNDNGSASSNIASVLPDGTYLNNDNILYYPGNGTFSGAPTYFDFDGLAFSLDNSDQISLNTFYIFIFPIAPGSTATDGTNSVSELISECVTPAPTPEPGSLALLGTAILGGAGVLRRRFAA
jgi:hypothetical protein